MIEFLLFGAKSDIVGVFDVHNMPETLLLGSIEMVDVNNDIEQDASRQQP